MSPGTVLRLFLTFEQPTLSRREKWGGGGPDLGEYLAMESLTDSFIIFLLARIFIYFALLTS